ncbi:MAG: hypothetical protein QME16_04725, partial [Planctomycetota bacterium]|nr:hypothetical protein [Planctomycetota bacterium]
WQSEAGGEGGRGIPLRITPYKSMGLSRQGGTKVFISGDFRGSKMVKKPPILTPSRLLPDPPRSLLAAGRRRSRLRRERHKGAMALRRQMCLWRHGSASGMIICGYYSCGWLRSFLDSA